MNWICQTSRLAVYLRDGLSCAWCGDGVEQGAILTLDHITPHSKGGSNDPSNLVTCCKRCNSSRGARSVSAFARAVAGYLGDGADAKKITAFVRATTRRTLKSHRTLARKLIASRGSVARVLAGREE